MTGTKLRREVGLLGLVAIALNGVIGSGIFVLPATVAGLLGPLSPLAYLVAAALTALVVLCFAEAGSRFEATGGPYLYAREAFGEFVGFEVGVMFFLSRLAAAAAISNACVLSLGYFAPALSQGAGRALVLTAVFAALALLNYRGVREGALVVNVFTVAKLVPLFVFVGVGWFAVDPASYSFSEAPDSLALRRASLLLIFAFGGFENASVPAEEAKNPRRDLPFALITAIALTAVLYISIQIVALGTLPGLAKDATPLASSAARFLGPAGGAVVTLGAVVSTIGSLSALVLVGPRILYSFGQAGRLSAALTEVHPRFATPHVAILVFALIAWASGLSGGFAQLAAISAFARLLFSATTCVAVLALRRRASPPAGFVVPGGPLVPLSAVALSLWLLSGVTREQLVAGAAALVVGAALFRLGAAAPTAK